MGSENNDSASIDSEDSEEDNVVENVLKKEVETLCRKIEQLKIEFTDSTQK